MELITLEHIVAVIVALTGLLTALRPFRVWVSRMWKKSIGRRKAQLDRIEAQLITNSGTSIRDMLIRIEGKQQEFEGFLTAQLNIHDVAVVRMDKEGKLIGINRQYQRMTGYSFEQVKGDGWINTIQPEERDDVLEHWNQAVASGREYHEDLKMLSNTGSTFIAHANIYKEVDSLGAIRGYLGVIAPWRDSDTCPYLCKQKQ